MIRPLALAALLLAVACQTADPPVVEQAADTAATAPAPAPAAVASDPNALTPDGWGPIRIGMTRAELVAAAGEDANPEAVGGPEPEQCDEFRPTGAPEGTLVMVEQGRVTRITLLRESPLRTERGFGVGDTAADVEAAYGSEATVTPHKYVDAPASYITVWTTAPPAPEPRGLVYETGLEGRVTLVHAGGPSIQYVEGCL